MHKINEQYKYTHPHTHGMSVLTPQYTDGRIIVTIKSIATGQTMKVYLDEPTQRVQKGVNITTYTGHFYEEEFMVTWSEGLEITGLPLIYSYWSGPSSDGDIRVIDAENHYYSEKYTDDTDPINLVEFPPIRYDFADIPFGETSSSRNAVTYKFTPFSGTSTGPGLPDPDEPIGGPTLDPGEGGLH